MKQSKIRYSWLLGVVTLIISTVSVASKEYNTRDSPDWPDTGEWLKLSNSLSLYSKLYGPFYSSDYNEQCGPDGIDDYTNPFEIAIGGEGVCMQYSSCAYEFCLEKSDSDAKSNLPAYTVMAVTEKDIVNSVRFANIHNIAVTVKSSGHSISGASMSNDSLMIWLAHYNQDNSIIQGFMDSCGDNSTTHDVIGVSAGQNFNSIAQHVGDDYHFVSAAASSVSASGGWIQGGGLSHTSRKYGLGVDNVLDFRVVLPSGSVVVADRCTNSDLFWALRGGGGGTFGVVTHMHYKLHPPTPIVHFNFKFGDVVNNTFAIGDFFRFWVEIAPTLDARWGGRFSEDDVDMFFAGGMTGAKLTLLDEFEEWVQDDSGMFSGDYEFSLDDTIIKEYSSWSKVLTALKSEAEGDYITEGSFSRLVPEKVAVNQRMQFYQMLESLALSGNLGQANYLLGGNIKNIRENETSVNPVLRESEFLISGNQYGYEKMLETLPNSVSGVDKNHHGALEPNWRESIWGDNYSRLLEIKSILDPTQVFNCYQSVGYNGQEVDIDNLGTLTPAPTPIRTGTIDPDTSVASTLGLQIGIFFITVNVGLLTLW